jgi:hypothetical protein
MDMNLPKYFLIKNFFTEEEYQRMWSELASLCQDELLIDSQSAGGAVDRDTKKLLRNNRGLPLESVYEDCYSSELITITNKMFEKDNLQRLKELDESFYSLEFPIKQTNLINHYMGGHSYGFHRDASLFTAITLFWREPKMFDGGALIFKNGNTTVNPLAGPRDLIIFPGYTEHSVTEVKLKAGVSAGNMSGRISLSKFIKIV